VVHQLGGAVAEIGVRKVRKRLLKRYVVASAANFSDFGLRAVIGPDVV
jgi:hypothetical protein